MKTGRSFVVNHLKKAAFCPFFPILQFLDPTLSVLPCFTYRASIRHIARARILPSCPALFPSVSVFLLPDFPWVSSLSVGTWHNSARVGTLRNSLHQNLILVWVPILSLTLDSSPLGPLLLPALLALPNRCKGTSSSKCHFLHSVSPVHRENWHFKIALDRGR